MDRWSRWREYPTKRAKTFRRIFTARIFIHLGTRFLWPSWTRAEESNFRIFFNGTRATSACRKQVAPIVLSASNWSILFLPFSRSLFLTHTHTHTLSLYFLFHSSFFSLKKKPGLLFLLSLLGPFDLVAVGQIVSSIGNSRVTPEPERETGRFFPQPRTSTACIGKVLSPTPTYLPFVSFRWSESYRNGRRTKQKFCGSPHATKCKILIEKIQRRHPLICCL